MGYTKADQAKHDEIMARISANQRKAIENAKVEIEKTKTERENIIKQKAEIRAKYDYEIECVKCKNDLAKAEIDKQIAEINKERDEKLAEINETEEKNREDFLLKYIEITEESNKDKLKIIINYYKSLYSQIIDSNERILDKFLYQQYKFAKFAQSSTGKAKAEYLLKMNDYDIRIAALQDSINNLNHFFIFEGPAMILNRLSTNKKDLELELRQEMALLEYQGDRE